MQSFEDIGRELERRGKTNTLKSLAQSPDGQKLGRMLEPGAVEKAARSGDMNALKNMLSQVLSTDEGKRLAESVRKMMQD